MVVVTIALETPEDEARLLELLPSVHGRILAKNTEAIDVSIDQATRKQKAIAALKRLSESGVADKFGDPSEWQREVRSWDRVLDGREE